MGWPTARTAEMPRVPVRPPGRHRRRQRAYLVLCLLGLVTIATAGALLTPALLNRARPVAASPAALATGSPPASTVAASPPASTTPTPTSPATRSPTGAPRPTHAATKPGSPPATPMPALENDVLNLTNQQRTDHGCTALRMDTHLLSAARLHSADMAVNTYFSHTSPDGRDPGARMKAAGYDVRGGWAENIAAGYPTPEAVTAGWMGSDGHRRNILNCGLRAIGIGISRGANGWLYWTQDFGGT